MDYPTIGKWSPGELQSFIETLARVPQTSLPPSLDMNSLLADYVGARTMLDFADNVKLAKQGKIFDPLQFVGADWAGEAQAMYAATEGAPSWRAGGGTIVAQNVDLPEAGDEYAAVDQRLAGALVYLPARHLVTNGHIFVSTIPSAWNGSYNALDLYRISDNTTPTAPVLTRITGADTIGGTISGSTGLKTIPFAQAQILDPGIYYVTLITHWSSKTGTLGFACKAATRASQNDSYLGGPMRSVYIDSQTSSPSSFTPTGPNANRIWVGLS